MSEDNAQSLSCDEAREHIVAASCGERHSPPVRERVTEHLQDCGACRAFQALSASAEELVGEAQAEEENAEAIAETAMRLAPSAETASEIVRFVHGLEDGEPAGASQPNARDEQLPEGYPLSGWPLRWPQVVFGVAAAALFVICLWQAVLLGRWTKAAGELAAGQGNVRLHEAVEARTAELRREMIALREEFTRTREQLSKAIEDAGRGLPQPAAILPVQLHQQESAWSAVRAAYFPDEEMRIRPAELSALMGAVQGTVLFCAEEYEPAIRSFRRAAEASDNRRFRLLSLFALGTSQKCAGRHEAAVETYDRILAMTGASPLAAPSGPSTGTPSGPTRDLNPKDPDAPYRAMARHFKGWSLHCLAARDADAGRPEPALKRLDEARRNYLLALGIEPGYAKVRLNLWALEVLSASLYAVLRQDAKQAESLQIAEEHLVRAESGLLTQVKEHPKDAKAHFSLAMLYACRGKDELALDYLEKAVARDASLSALLASEHDFDRLAATPRYRALARKSHDFADRAQAASLFTDTNFPSGSRAAPSRRPPPHGP